MQPKENLQTRKVNALAELGEKIFLDRYAIKDAKKETMTVGDTVVVCVNLKTGQREIGTVEKVDQANHEVIVKLRDGSLETRAIEHVDKPLETVPEQMFERIAKHIASVEATPEAQTEWEGRFRELMDDWKYVPAGRIFTGAGTGQNLTYYNCYVIPSPKDSRQGIFDTLGQMAEIMSRGGGVGINVSTLRPRYAYVKGVNGRSSGAVSWASLYSFVTGLIEQGGSRRGALMLILNVWHPDVIDFINSKKEAGRITNANISVGITDDFMLAVKNDQPWDLIFPDTSDPMFKDRWDGNITRWKEIGGRVIKHKTVRAKDIWENIISSAWGSAEPGMYFIDRANYYSNSGYYADLPCTNPCGEQPLPAWGVCNLGHVNLAKHVDTAKKDVDWNKLKRTVQDAVRFQDNVIDATPYFFDQNYKQQMSERRVGMGTIGLAEMLINLGLRYGSPQGVEFIDKLYQFIAITAYETSIDLAREKGTFGQFDAEQFLQSGFMKKMPEYIRHLVRQYGIRNVTILTQAPTGTIGTMVGTSTGVEPFFSWTYFRKSRLGVHQEHIKLAKDWLDAHPGESLPDYFVTAMELTPEEHVRVQAAVQRWTDSAISKTVNAPENYTVEQTAKLYEMLYDLGCKGGTIYRDGSRDEQILATDHKKLGKDASDQVETQQRNEAIQAAAKLEAPVLSAPEPIVNPVSIPATGATKISPRKRPDVMQGSTYKVPTAYGNLYVTVNEDEYGPFEVFSQLGKAGGFFGAQTEAICRMISLALRSGISLPTVVEQLKGIRGPDPVFHNGERILSLPDAIANVLENHTKRGQIELKLEIPKVEAPKVVIQQPVFQAVMQEIHTAGSPFTSQKVSIADNGNAPVCMMCGDMLRMTEGCQKCESCGWSKC
ncbi:MAG: ribonucleoside-diphosphate reductase, adenosylcobalamin-dependent [Candidatus Doudnabacteria bacterium RIFCSPLOWO2_02_FULL_49_13]|uniref:Vitamin B12-dependent ribonucleotide reductase n=1 Tax=Candidatus Doudnabacteria bacterium RIFCSPHIGHO2_12_FULL_48_16 TaxID=1817838 RepID=A0A1F5PJW9_9BACT|nr:MAG: ribonucleoside-diphosphate reductase, adenosylcobalamin-dependent [Candidatus Doudnabacteria bacterium RIFCSPHIGHO2_02_FULL_49_24]OGE89514.1 MAG: ribonucleoside-diphosphate reductase, adenosylcobalamin-dependent [Candidatus Doudnabacteria bacterium RIFCSPHIGHO2_01_FULL_50_67]OGE90191.1 MAG: ribonucleoside-diphosphate reductase, adenosylcobalamin-dependent [Candidatus Doudnabacteria bacterium RIFCSPHIGHO2_12_FULL_48_16]OGE97732.1 MAG: ribonucleoside-diphosphate reductase, adenosylcobalami